MLTAMMVVLEIGRAKSFAAAARKLKISPPSVSRIVSDLEADLGVRLFARSTRHVGLTVEGTRFLARAETILAEVEALRATARESQRAVRGQLVLSSAVAFGNELLAEAAADFLDRFPEVRVKLNLTSRSVDLIEEHVDIAFRVGQGRLPDTSMVATKVLDYRMIFAATPDYVAAHGKPAEIGDMDGRRIFKLATGNWGHVHMLEGPAGTVEFRVPDTFEIDGYRGQLLATLSGRGIGLLHDYVAAPEIRAGRLVQVLPRYRTVPQTVFAVYMHRELMPWRTRVFLDFLKVRFREPIAEPA